MLRRKRQLIIQFSLALIVFLIVASAPSFMYEQRFNILMSHYWLWYIFYWLLVTVLFTGLVAYQKYRLFDRHFRRLTLAAQQVTKGDFSVYLAPTRQQSVTELDTVMANFNTMVAELGSTETFKNDFVANVSHEFKAPLAVIKSYATLLKEHATATNDQEHAQTIITAADNLATMVSNILKLTKIDNQAIVPNRQRYDVSRQLTDVLLTFEPLWDQRQIALELTLPETLMIDGDPEMLQLVWHNLLSNAFKFTPHGGTVAITVAVDATHLSVAVRDTGIGMDEVTAARIFDKFYQGDTSHASSGNGLGLALAQRIVTVMGGDITVLSQLGVGSTFTVWLPK